MAVLNNPSVISAIFYETGTYDDQIGRGYYSKGRGDGDLTDLFMDITNEGTSITDSVVSEIATDIIGYDFSTKNVIDIPNGWDTKRFGFILAIAEQASKHSEKIHILTGYTDHSDISHGGRLDPDMELYINNSMIFRNQEIDVGGRGRRRRQVQISNDQVIRGRYKKGRRGRSIRDSIAGRDDGEYLIRPADMFYHNSSLGIIAQHGGAGSLIDGRTGFNSDIRTGIRRHNNVSSYLTDIVRAGVASRNLGGVGEMGEGDYEDRWDQQISREMAQSPDEYAAASLDRRHFQRSATFRSLMNRAEFEENAMITLDELTACVDWNDDITNVFTSGRVSRDGARELSERGRGQRWDSSTPECVAATIASRSIPAMTLNSLISECTIMITNETIDGSIEVVVSNERPVIQGLDVSDRADSLEDIIKYDLARVLTRNNQIDLTMTIYFNVLYDQEIQVSIDGNPREDFFSPLMCDGLISPQKTTDIDTLKNIADDIDDIVGSISNNIIL